MTENKSDTTVSKTDAMRISSAENTAIAQNPNIVKSEPVVPPAKEDKK
jgi:hypothetical protein